VSPPNGIKDVLRLMTHKDWAIEWDSRQRATSPGTTKDHCRRRTEIF
jgi:hypothetical protein